MFSKKFDYNTSGNKLSLLLEEKRKSGERIFDLTESNPTNAGFVYDNDKILNAISTAESLKYNPGPRGILSARIAVAKYYKSKGIKIDEDCIFLTSSTSEAYSFIFKLIADPFDEVLIPTPGYPLFPFIAELESINIKFYHLKYSKQDGFRIDFDSLKSNITEKTKAIITVNPNNPAGNFLCKNDFQGLINVCVENNAALICDEVFFDYNISKESEKRVSSAGIGEILSFTLSGISKICALPQMKLSWIVLNGPGKIPEEAKSRLEIITDTYLSVGTPVQLALPTLLETRHGIQKQISERINSNYSFLKKEFAGEEKISVLNTEGGWYAVIKINTQFDEEKFAFDLLDKKNVYVHPGYFFDFVKEGYIVVSLLVKPIDFEEGILKIKSFTADLF